MSASCDVAVIGGGPAGSAAAITLARAGRKVLLVDAGPAVRFKIGEALPPAATPLLREMGVLDRLAGDGHLRSYGNESAWGSSSVHNTDFIRDPRGCGWRLDRLAFDAMLRRTARESGAAVFEKTHAVDAQRIGAIWKLSLRGASVDQVRAHWLIDCTGRVSWLARRQTVRRILHDRLIAFYALFQSSKQTDLDSLTLVESAADGWWYTALLPSGRRLAAYHTDADGAARLKARDARGFSELVAQTQHVFRRLKLHEYSLYGAPDVTAANSARLENFGGEGWLVAGDAAMSHDPLSSQGITTALYSGIRAARAIDAKIAGRSDALAEYPTLLENVHAAYRRNLALYYGYERRWLQPFWQRRQMQASAAVP